MKTGGSIPFFALIGVFLINSFCKTHPGNIKTDAASGTDTFATRNADTIPIPNAIGWVNDFEGILSAEEEEELEQIILDHESKTSNQITIVTIDSLFASADEFSAFTLRLLKTWGVGTKEKKNGIVIAFGKKLRMIRIENGYGIEPIMTKDETKKIIDETIVPPFKEGKFFEGVKAGLLKIIEELNKPQ